MEPVQKCRHCDRPRNKHAGRGLCLRCYKDKNTRSQYDQLKKVILEKGHGLRSPSGQPEPTLALPGTEDKITALEKRARSGKELWHKQDRQYDDPSPWQAGQREEEPEDFFD